MEKSEEVVLTEEDKEKIQIQVDEKFDKQLQEIFDKILEKAKWLLHMSVPNAYRHLKTDDTKSATEDDAGMLLIKHPSYVPKQVKADEVEKEKKDNWVDRLKQWHTMQTSKGSIKSFTELRSEIFESTNMSVLAFLQTPMTA